MVIFGQFPYCQYNTFSRVTRTVRIQEQAQANTFITLFAESLGERRSLLATFFPIFITPLLTTPSKCIVRY